MIVCKIVGRWVDVCLCVHEGVYVCVCLQEEFNCLQQGMGHYASGRVRVQEANARVKTSHGATTHDNNKTNKTEVCEFMCVSLEFEACVGAMS